MIEFKCKKNSKLYDAIKENGTSISYNEFYKLIRKKEIKVNGKSVDGDIELNAKDKVRIYYQVTNNEFKPDIIFDDKKILIINKPIGLETTGEDSLETKLLSYYYPKKVFACHRLDRNTSGLVIFAKTKNVALEFEDAFKKGFVHKFYLCNAYGIFEKKSEKLKAFLFKDSKKSLVFIKDEPAKGYVKIETHYKVLKQYSDYAALEVKLITGRTHQIRAHLAHIGHPLIGDGKYGKNNINKDFKEYKQNLISYKLCFDFPASSSLNYLNEKAVELDITLRRETPLQKSTLVAQATSAKSVPVAKTNISKAAPVASKANITKAMQVSKTVAAKGVDKNMPAPKKAPVKKDMADNLGKKTVSNETTKNKLDVKTATAKTAVEVSKEKAVSKTKSTAKPAAASQKTDTPIKKVAKDETVKGKLK